MSSEYLVLSSEYLVLNIETWVLRFCEELCRTNLKFLIKGCRVSDYSENPDIAKQCQMK